MPRQGVDWVALHDLEDFPSAQLSALIGSARRHGIKIMAAANDVPTARLAIELKLDSLEYLPGTQMLPEALAQRLAQQGYPAVAAPIGYYRRIAAAVRAPSAVAVLGTPAKLTPSQTETFVQEFDAWMAASGFYRDAAQLFSLRQANFRQLLAAGATLLLATDVGSAGQYHDRAIWTELAEWQRQGISQIETLQVATAVASDSLAMVDVGVIAVGRYADLLLIDGASEERLNPSMIRYVIKGGVVHLHRFHGRGLAVAVGVRKELGQGAQARTPGKPARIL